MIMTEEQLLFARAHIKLCKFLVNVIFLRREVFGLALVLGFGLMPFVEHHRSIHAEILFIIGNFSQHGFLAARLQIVLLFCGCDDPSNVCRQTAFDMTVRN